MYSIELKYFKLSAVYCLILGAISALISLIPFFMPVISLLFIPFLGVIIPFILLVKKDGFYTDENKAYAILGAFGGFCLCISYLIVFSPLVLLIHLVNKNYYAYGIQFLHPFLAVLFFVMIAVVYSSANSVVGLIIGFIYKYLKGKTNA